MPDISDPPIQFLFRIYFPLLTLVLPTRIYSVITASFSCTKSRSLFLLSTLHLS
ncbi:hypothetical protein B0H10DRAFT_2146537 [Mycena sp. CBHHK59/15]|nr:hypothetical protein B0H10DRAFT_2146537 [Mycena sp. CBHHK59/15]